MSMPYQGEAENGSILFFSTDITHLASVVRAGDKIPHIKLLDVQSSRELSLADEVFQDKILVIDFWATWSGPCEVCTAYLKPIAMRYLVIALFSSPILPCCRLRCMPPMKLLVAGIASGREASYSLPFRWIRVPELSVREQGRGDGKMLFTCGAALGHGSQRLR